MYHRDLGDIFAKFKKKAADRDWGGVVSGMRCACSRSNAE
jgi:hypothetical protein